MSSRNMTKDSVKEETACNARSRAGVAGKLKSKRAMGQMAGSSVTFAVMSFHAIGSTVNSRQTKTEK